MEKIKKLSLHIAFIMDGNGRFALKRGLPRFLGHKKGCERIIDIYDECYKLGVKAMSLYAFSTENWKRPKEEIDHLFSYLEIFFNNYINKINNEGSRICVSGDISRLPIKTQDIIKKAVELTKNNNKFYFNICLNYGGQQEIVRACQLFANEVKEGKKDINDLDITSFNEYLYTYELPPVDLLIRTSGEYRISNFMLYQLAYAEFIFSPVTWPEFNQEELYKCLQEYQNRNRRFGGLANE